MRETEREEATSQLAKWKRCVFTTAAKEGGRERKNAILSDTIMGIDRGRKKGKSDERRLSWEVKRPNAAWSKRGTHWKRGEREKWTGSCQFLCHCQSQMPPVARETCKLNANEWNLAGRGGFPVDVVMEMANDTNAYTQQGHVCVGWIGQGEGGGYKGKVDGRLMKMKEQRTVYLRVWKRGRRTACGQ